MTRSPSNRILGSPLGALCAALFLCVSCADDAGLSDTDTDAGGIIDVGGDSAAEELESCLDTLASGDIVLVPSSSDSQIHVDAAFDGEAVWVVYASFDAEGGGDIFATRVACDGTVLVDPQPMNVAFDFNELDPSVAVSGGRVLVAWHADNGSSPSNLDIYLRLLDRDGTPRWAEERLYEGVVGGEINTRNAWMPDLAPMPDGGFVLAGAWGTEGAPAFQAFAQRFDADAEPVGEAVNVSLDAEATQVEPEVAASATGRVAVAWPDSPLEGDDRALVRIYDAVPGGLGAAEGPAYEPLPGSGADRPAVAFTDAGELRVALAQPATGGSEVIVVDEAGEVVSRWSDAGGYYGPVLARSDGGVAAAWLRVLSGTRAELFLGFAGQAAPIEVAGDPPVGPYETVLTAVGGGDVVFTAWAEGTSPEFSIRGRFLRAP